MANGQPSQSARVPSATSPENRPKHKPLPYRPMVAAWVRAAWMQPSLGQNTRFSSAPQSQPSLHLLITARTGKVGRIQRVQAPSHSHKPDQSIATLVIALTARDTGSRSHGLLPVQETGSSPVLTAGDRHTPAGPRERDTPPVLLDGPTTKVWLASTHSTQTTGAWSKVA